MRAETIETQEALALAIHRCRVTELQAHTQEQAAHKLRTLLQDPTATYASISSAAWLVHVIEEREEAFADTRRQLAHRLNPHIALHP